MDKITRIAGHQELKRGKGTQRARTISTAMISAAAFLLLSSVHESNAQPITATSRVDRREEAMTYHNHAGLGVGIRLTAAVDLRPRMRSFMVDGLGGVRREDEQKDRDYFRFPNGSRAVVFYVDPDKALTYEQAKCGAWLEMNVVDLSRTMKSLEQAGIRPFDYLVDTSHNYVQAPNGQVFRLVAAENGKPMSP